MRTLPAFESCTLGKFLAILFAITVSACSTPARPPAPIVEQKKPATAPPAKPVQEEAAVIVSKLVVDEPKRELQAVQPAPASKEPEKFVPHIALLVPLASKALGSVADALRLALILASVSFLNTYFESYACHCY